MLTNKINDKLLHSGFEEEWQASARLDRELEKLGV
jgi:hypothetical protein